MTPPQCVELHHPLSSSRGSDADKFLLIPLPCLLRAPLADSLNGFSSRVGFPVQKVTLRWRIMSVKNSECLLLKLQVAFVVVFLMGNLVTLARIRVNEVVGQWLRLVEGGSIGYLYNNLP